MFSHQMEEDPQGQLREEGAAPGVFCLEDAHQPPRERSAEAGGILALLSFRAFEALAIYPEARILNGTYQRARRAALLPDEPSPTVP